MAPRKTDPEPLPVRGTPTGYRDHWECDDCALIEAQITERESLLTAVRACAGPQRRGQRDASGESPQPVSPADRIAVDS
jgi:hypothetical protein